MSPFGGMDSSAFEFDSVALALSSHNSSQVMQTQLLRKLLSRRRFADIHIEAISEQIQG